MIRSKLKRKIVRREELEREGKSVEVEEVEGKSDPLSRSLSGMNKRLTP